MLKSTSMARGAVLASAAALLTGAAPSEARPPLATCQVHDAVRTPTGFSVRGRGSAVNIGNWELRVAGANVPGFPITSSVNQTTASFDRTINVNTVGAVYTNANVSLVFAGPGPDYACRAGITAALTPLGLASVPG